MLSNLFIACTRRRRLAMLLLLIASLGCLYNRPVAARPVLQTLTCAPATTVLSKGDDLTVTGMAAPGATVRVLIDDEPGASVVAVDDGSFAITLVVEWEGAAYLSCETIDENGRQLDLYDDAIVVIASPEPLPTPTYSQPPALCQHARPILTVGESLVIIIDGAANDTVYVHYGDTEASVRLDSEGAGSYVSLPFTEAGGPYTLHCFQRDGQGNEYMNMPQPLEEFLIVDGPMATPTPAVEPGTPISFECDMLPDTISLGDEVLIAGKATPGQLVHIYIDDTFAGSTVAGSDGAFATSYILGTVGPTYFYCGPANERGQTMTLTFIGAVTGATATPTPTGTLPTATPTATNTTIPPTATITPTPTPILVCRNRQRQWQEGHRLVVFIKGDPGLEVYVAHAGGESTVTLDSGGSGRFISEPLANTEGADSTLQCGHRGQSAETSYRGSMAGAVFTVGDATAAPVAITCQATNATPAVGEEIRITGKTKPGTNVRVVMRDTLAGRGQADGDGDFTVTVANPWEGVANYGCDAVDARGRTLGVNAADRFVTIGGTPEPPVPPACQVAGSAAREGEPATIDGSAMPGATVQLFISGQGAGKAVAGSDGQFTIEHVFNSPGVQSFYCRIIDASGQAITPVENISFVIVSPLPTPTPTPAMPIPTLLTCRIAPDEVTVGERVELIVRGPAGAVVLVEDGYQFPQEITLDERGQHTEILVFTQPINRGVFCTIYDDAGEIDQNDLQFIRVVAGN